jgi:flagellar biosynthesis protein FliQ
MSEADVIDILRQTLFAVAVVAGPSTLAAMLVGLVVALLQALTQIQEMTLTFVPKIIAVFLVAFLSAKTIGGTLSALTLIFYNHIEAGF